MDATTILTIIGIVVAVILGIWQIQLARKQIHLSKAQTNNAPKSQESSKESDQPNTQADNQSVAVGKIEIGGAVNGNITIGNAYYRATEKDGRTQTNLVADENKYKERPYPSEIFEQLDNLPLWQQGQARNSYIGLKVRWRTMLMHIIGIKKDVVALMMRDRAGFPTVYGRVNILEYPELKIAKAGHWMWVEGQIGSIEIDQVNLEDCKIKLD